MCRCRGLEGIDLALCLAPPPGEYEVDLKVGRDKSIIVNSEGVYLRQLVTDETLPFINTLQRPLPPRRAMEIAGLTLENLYCIVVRQLKAASQAGSITARRKLGECFDVIKKIEEECTD